MLEARGEARGKKIGETRLATLFEKLYSLGRDEDAKLAVKDEVERAQLYEELYMVNWKSEASQIKWIKHPTGNIMSIKH